MTRIGLFLLGPLAAGIVVHLWVLDLPFFSDDYFFLSVFLKPDFQTVDWARLWETVACRQFLWPVEAPYYRPLGLTLLLGQFQLWGAWPAGYHAIALLLFAGTVALLGLLILTLTDSKGAALIGSLLFAIYPLHQEAIVYVSASVFDLHAGFWLLAALLSLARWLAAGTPGWAVATISAIGFALLAKEAALLSPVMLTAALWLWPRPNPKLGWRLGALAGAVWLVFVGLLLYRASCFGALKGTGLLYLNPSLLLASFVKFVSFHLFSTGLLGSNWEAAAALAATSVGVIALLGRKGNRLTLWWGTLAVLGALPVLGAIGGNLADPGRPVVSFPPSASVASLANNSSPFLPGFAPS